MAASGKIEWVSFDVYSALFDYRACLLPKLRGICRGLSDDAVASLLDLWRSRQLAVAMHHALLQRGHLSFRVATRLALDYALQMFGVSLATATRETLVWARDTLDPWPEAPAVLAALSGRGYRLALLSNGDQSMLEALAQRLPVHVDAIFSAQRAEAYKPHPDIYWCALNSLDIAPTAVLHVAGSSTDVMGARSAGLRCAWSNRFGDRVIDTRLPPNYMLTDLSGLLELLPASAAAGRAWSAMDDSAKSCIRQLT